MKLNSIRFKISILNTIILGLILLIYSGFLYFSLHSTLYEELDGELKAKYQGIKEAIGSYLKIIGEDEPSFIFAARRVITLKGEYPGQKKELSNEQKMKAVEFEKEWQIKYDKLDLSEDFVNIISVDGKSFIRSKNLIADLRTIFVKRANYKNFEGENYKKVKFKKRNLRLFQAPLSSTNTPPFIIQIATSQKPVIELLQKRQGTILASIPFILIASIFLGRFLASRILQPVAEITSTAKNITHENLSDRLQLKYVDEEMKYLIDAFNEMIGRLDSSFKHIAEFSSQVAHELKTPIAIIRGECEIALRKERPVEEYKRILKVNLEEAKRMLKITEDLLLLAKLDYRPEIFTFETFSFNDFIKEIHEQASLLASEKKIQVGMKTPKTRLKLKGDKIHLRRLFFNIIHNAIKFTPEDGNIDLEIMVQNDEVKIHIADTGVGIKEDDLAQIFNRFYQVEHAETTSEPSSGLGLNIAQSIAKLHFGQIHVKSKVHKGTTFTIILPLV